MAKGAKGAAAAAAAAAAAEVSSRVPPNIAHGVRVTLGFFVVYYAFLFAQATLKRKLRTYYATQGKKVCTAVAAVGFLRPVLFQAVAAFLAFDWLPEHLAGSIH